MFDYMTDGYDNHKPYFNYEACHRCGRENPESKKAFDRYLYICQDIMTDEQKIKAYGIILAELARTSGSKE